MTNGASFFKAYLSNFQKYGCDAAVLLGHMTAQIAWHEQQHRQGAWFHSIRVLAEELGLTPKKVRTALAKLVDAGQVRVEKGVGPNNTYGYRLGQSTADQVVPQVKPSAAVGQTGCSSRANRFIPQGKPIKLDRKSKKESMQACKEMPACRSYEKNPTTSKHPANPSQREVVVILESAGLDGASVRSLARVCEGKGVCPAELRWMIGDLESRRRHPVKSLGALLRTRIEDDDFLQVREQLADRERQQKAEQHRQATEWIRERKVLLQQRIVSLMGTGFYDELQLELMRIKSTADGYAMRLDGEMIVIPYNTAFMSHASRAIDQLERRIVEAEESKFARSQAKSASSSHSQRPARM